MSCKEIKWTSPLGVAEKTHIIFLDAKIPVGHHRFGGSPNPCLRGRICWWTQLRRVFSIGSSSGKVNRKLVSLWSTETWAFGCNTACLIAHSLSAQSMASEKHKHRALKFSITFRSVNERFPGRRRYGSQAERWKNHTSAGHGSGLTSPA